MIEIFINDHISHRVRLKCNLDDTIKDIKTLIAFKIGTRPEKIRLHNANKVFSDSVTLDDYEIQHGSEISMSYD